MCLVLNIEAQVKSRYSFGINLSTMALDVPGLNSNPTVPLGIHFGRIFEIPVAGNFTFQPGILFSSKGTDYNTDSAHFSLSPIYIEVPVNVAFSLGKGNFRIFFFTGPYLACGVGGTRLDSRHGLKEIRFGNGSDKDLRLFDAGLDFGAAVNIKKIVVSAQYSTGLTNIAPLTEDKPEMKNRVIGISFSSAFIGKN